MTRVEHILAVLGYDIGGWSQGWQAPIGTPGQDYLSDGLRQIVSLTPATADSPNILLLDEPFIYLDTRATRGLIDRALPIGFPRVTYRLDLPVTENTTVFER